MNYRSRNRKITIGTVLWAFLIILASIPALIVCIVIDLVFWILGIDDEND